MFIDATFNFGQKSSRWPRSEAISTGSELPNGCSSLIYFHGHAVMGFWLSIIRPRGTCKLLGSEILWFLDMSPAGPLFSWRLRWVFSGGHCCQAQSSCFAASWRQGCLQTLGSVGDPRSRWVDPPVPLGSSANHASLGCLLCALACS